MSQEPCREKSGACDLAEEASKAGLLEVAARGPRCGCGGNTAGAV